MIYNKLILLALEELFLMSKALSRMFFMLILMLSFVLVFSGCSLWTLNEQKVANQKAATIDDITVTYDDVYKAYYNYGNYYFDNQGEATYDGMKTTATQLINRKVLVKALKDKDSKYYTQLTQAQINEVWNNLYKEINSALVDYQKAIMEKDDKTITELTTGEEEETYDQDYEKPYEKYEKKYKYELNTQTGQFELTKVQPEEEIATTSTDVFQFTAEELAGKTIEEKLASMTLDEIATRATNNFKNIFWTHKNDLDKNAKGELYCELAFNKLISVLKSNEKDKSLNMEAKYVFYRYFDKTFEDLYDSALITAFQENYEKTQVFTEENVLSAFNKLAEGQIETYSNDYNNYSAFVSAMKSRSEPMLYFNKINEWFQVSHVLLKYSEDDVTALKKLQEDFKNGKITEESIYEQKVKDYKNSIKFTDRKDGNKYTAKQVLEMIQDAMGISVDGTGQVSYNTSITAEERVQIFNDFIYRFNMDNGANNALLAYSIPTDTKNDGMVTPFANASRALHDAGVVGSISDLIEIDEILGYDDNDGNNQKPSYSGMHIVIYLGEYETLSTTGSASVQDLNNYILNPLNNNETNSETMLDYVIEKMTSDNFNSYQSSVLQSLKDGKEIKYYDGVIKDLVKAFK